MHAFIIYIFNNNQQSIFVKILRSIFTLFTFSLTIYSKTKHLISYLNYNQINHPDTFPRTLFSHNPYSKVYSKTI